MTTTTTTPLLDPAPTGDAAARGGAHLAYQPALDGLRALAVIGVLLYHGGNDWVPGGYLGVDLFFTLSGFLITTLLVLEWRATGAINLAQFYVRRTRRLLPPLFLGLGLVGVYALFFAPVAQMAQLRGDVLGAVFYVSNWRFILAGQSYFEQFLSPSPVNHLWSLAIEEQWYFFWPLAMIGLLYLVRGRLARLGVVIAGLALASAVWMAWLAHSGASLNRLYLGTDTRAQSLLVGAALAVLTVAFGPPTRRMVRAGLQAAAAVALVGLVVSWFFLDDRTTGLYRFGYLTHALAVAVVIAAVLVPGPVTSMLGVRPARYIGKISYGLYLYHWPIYLMITSGRTGLSGPALFAVRVAVSVAAAALSYHFVEMPIRRGVLHGWVRITGAVALAALIVIGIVATTYVRGSGATARGDVAPASGTGVLERPVPTDLAPLRVMFTGDSLPDSLAQAFPQLAREGILDGINAGRLGCGFAEVGDERTLAGLTADPASCGDVYAVARERMQQDRPQVLALFGGVWEMADRRIDGTWYRYPDPTLDQAVIDGWTRMIATARAEGVEPVILTTPYFRREATDGTRTADTDPARVRHLNDLLVQVGDRTGTPVIDTNAYLSKDGDFTATLDGREVRAWDGTHFTPAGAYFTDIYVRNRLVELVESGRLAVQPG